MTVGPLLPAMHRSGPITLSREVLDGHPAYGPLLADAATTGRCPVLALRGHAGRNGDEAPVSSIDATATYAVPRWALHTTARASRTTGSPVRWPIATAFDGSRSAIPAICQPGRATSFSHRIRSRTWERRRRQRIEGAGHGGV